MNLKGKKVLVTGSEGFIGSHLVEKLVSMGADVRAFVLYNSFNNWGWLETLPKAELAKIEIFTGNICEAYNVRQAMDGIDVVFHLAALIAIPYSYYSPESYVSTNVMGTLNVLQAARDQKVAKFVHTSTSETYGTALYVPIDEKHPLQGQSPYSASKIGADMIAESFYRSFNLPVATCRPFNTYGPRQSARAVIPTIISQIASGAKKIKLGSLTPVRDLTYVKDTAEGFVKIAESEKSNGEVINLGVGSGVTVGELADRIISLMGTKVEIISDEQRVRPEKSEVMRLISDNKKALDFTGWQPKTSLENGLKETIDFIAKNLDRYKPDIYNL
ncbi:MAG: NAD-dependent 4,6-dehydratase LegB [Candidatus Margulisbacteria bacterium]|nr:NAD-dependent 4,6-dehydratase LegB [Candidatus Margulisiibacteriota bacterium]MBU1617348.1 NAD-dependent 4,6-dehydratase LegB [Candidatus Margulisiibacteriota bacterium]